MSSETTTEMDRDGTTFHIITDITRARTGVSLAKIIIQPSQTESMTRKPLTSHRLKPWSLLSIDGDGLLPSPSVFVAFVIVNLTGKVLAISHQSAIFGYIEPLTVPVVVVVVRYGEHF